MADYEIPDTPIFRETMKKLEPKDRNHADVFNTPYETLLKNDNYLKKQINENGRVLIGDSTTELRPNDTLFLLEPDDFSEARIANMTLGDENPDMKDNWGTNKQITFLEGKLTVADQPTADTVFFVDTEGKQER